MRDLCVTNVLGNNIINNGLITIASQELMALNFTQI